MTAWGERSRTTAVMLNPALLAVIVGKAAQEYRANCDHAMPWPLAFIVAPLVLHRGTRTALPKTTRAKLGTWVSEHPVEHAGFATRAQSLRKPVQEGVRFGLANGVLTVDREGRLIGTLGKGRGHTLEQGTEAQQIIAKAGFVGKWLTKIDQPTTAFVILGVTP